jgi:hypothetical protein
MKTLIILLLYLGATAATGADSAEQVKEEMCMHINNVAESIMLGRQNGMPMIQQRQSALGMHEALRDAVLEMVRTAYEEPAWSTDENKQHAVREFADGWYARCLRDASVTPR